MAQPVDPQIADRYRASGWWGDEMLSDRVRRLARSRPDDPAYLTATGSVSWSGYDQWADSLASTFLDLALEAKARVGVILPDGPTVHIALLALERAGLVAVGIGARAGDREIAHLLALTGARTVVCHPERRGRPSGELLASLRDLGVSIDRLVVVGDVLDDEPTIATTGAAQPWAPVPGHTSPAPESELRPDDLFLLNSTSGTTGLPKCVAHTQNRWFYFHQLASEAGQLCGEDIFMGLVPAPFGFGLWTAHFTPTLLAAPTVVMERFRADEALDLIERHGVTVLCCVSTQFIMLLNAQAENPRDLSSLRVMFTGGENVPYERAAEFEEQTGAKVLQFYGSNETGALSATTSTDARERRLRTAGRVIDAMDVRLFDPETGEEILEAGRPGQPACRGPATCLGYWGDDEANAQLFTADGWMLMGDIVEIDPDGYLTVVGRTSDFIIRGGKNISAPAVEDEVGSHPSVAMVAAVAMPDPVFGERVCVYVVPRGGEITLEDITAHLDRRGVSREWFPERLVVVSELPRSSGGKVAKADLREDLARRLARDA